MRVSISKIFPVLIPCLFLSTIGQADHTIDHEVQNLKGGLSAIEQRLWDCENGINGVCPGSPGPQGPVGPQGLTGPAGSQGPQGIPGADADNSKIAALEAAVAALVSHIVNSAPTSFDDMNNGFSVGKVWIDTSQNQAYILVDNTPGLAVWRQITNNYAIGGKGPAGGIVFHITDGGLHGLEAAPEDQISSPWGCIGIDIPGAEGATIGTGAQNTTEIILECTEVGIAARVANDYVLNGYTDWFLPSVDEALQMFKIREVLGNLPTLFYWSSTEPLPNSANCVASTGADFKYACQKDTFNGVRAIRAF